MEAFGMGTKAMTWGNRGHSLCGRRGTVISSSRVHTVSSQYIERFIVLVGCFENDWLWLLALLLYFSGFSCLWLAWSISFFFFTQNMYNGVKALRLNQSQVFCMQPYDGWNALSWSWSQSQPFWKMPIYDCSYQNLNIGFETWGFWKCSGPKSPFFLPDTLEHREINVWGHISHNFVSYHFQVSHLLTVWIFCI